MDLPRTVKFKPRNSKENEFVPKWSREGRTFDDFLAFVEDNDELPPVQLDTVIGRIGGKVIMAIRTTAENSVLFQHLKMMQTVTLRRICFSASLALHMKKRKLRKTILSSEILFHPELLLTILRKIPSILSFLT